MARPAKRVVRLEIGDETVYGRVTYREGRKVWFGDRIITFPSEDDEVEMDGDER